MQKTLAVNGIVLKYKQLDVNGAVLDVLEGITRIEKGWKFNLKRNGKKLISSSRKDRGRSPRESLKQVEREFIDKINSLNPDDLKRKSNSIDIGQRGVNIAWAHRNATRKGKPSHTHALLITIVYKPNPDERSKLKTFHAGSPKTITQRKLNSALMNAYAMREHYEHVKLTSPPWSWPTIRTMRRKYAKEIEQYPLARLETLLESLGNFQG